MAKVEIYTSMLCGYCHAAKRLLKERGAQFVEYDVGCDAEKRASMSERAGGEPPCRRSSSTAGISAAATNSMLSIEPASSPLFW